MKILFILPYSPIPTNTGNKNLTFNLLKYLNQKSKYCAGSDKFRIEEDTSVIIPVSTFKKTKSINHTFNNIFRPPFDLIKDFGNVNANKSIRNQEDSAKEANDDNQTRNSISRNANKFCVERVEAKQN